MTSECTLETILNIARAAVIAIAVALWGCGSAQTSRASEGGNMNDADPVSFSLTARIINGTLTATTVDKSLVELKKGQTISKCLTLKAQKGHAMVTLGDSEKSGVIWLRQNTELQLRQTVQGEVLLRLVRGEVRVALNQTGITVIVQDTDSDSTPDITGQDVMIFHNATSGKSAVIATAARTDLAMWSILMSRVADAGGIGSLTATQDGHKVHLSLADVTIEASQKGDVVLNRVTHVFYNDADTQLEGTFRFPLPAGAIIIGLAMEINGRLMEGELVEREKARQTYESIVDAMRDPALLEWQQGQMFKLRVFPIEPKSQKRIVLRFLSPLRATPAGLEYVYPTAAADMQTAIDHFSVTWNGVETVNQKHYAPGNDVVIKASSHQADGGLAQEKNANGTFYTMRVSPFNLLVKKNAAATLPQTSVPNRHQHLVIIFDTSRSALETIHLATESLGIVLNTLTPADRFTLIAGDVDATSLFESVPATQDRINEAIAAIKRMECDGASNLAAAMETAATIINGRVDPRMPVQILYIGDGTPTWGITRQSDLIAYSNQHFKDHLFNAIAIGKGANTDLLNALVSTTGGRVATPRTVSDVDGFALFAAKALWLPRLKDVRIETDNPMTLYPKTLPAIYGDESFTVYAHHPANTTPPAFLTLKAEFDGKPVQTQVPFNAPNSKTGTTAFVSQQFGAQHIADLEKQDDKHREEIVQASLSYGVMSRYTSFLVLESEEAYRRYGIERKNHADSQSPRVSGQDLESISDREAGLNPSHIQPGDPEIRIPAPADARSVVVVFPFGETKIATWEESLNAWTVRFLIDRDTPEGIWEVIVRITHADGQIEIVKLNYTVDTTAPTVRLQLCANTRKPGWMKLVASQIETAADMESLTPRFNADGASAQATFLPDLRRVEVELATGRILRMKYRPESNTFVAHIKRRIAPDENDALRVIGFDRALNVSEKNVVVEGCHE
ncbi:MAG: hypothetical protein JXX14_00610 [Deltaproteobacteria bacterium]|nr:hypothetical protein [Deltaproteobacteria bacterium]